MNKYNKRLDEILAEKVITPLNLKQVIAEEFKTGLKPYETSRIAKKWIKHRNGIARLRVG